MGNYVTMQMMDAGQNFLTGNITSAFAASGVELAGSTVFELASNLQTQAQMKAEEVQKGAMTLVSSAGAGLGTTFGTVVGAGLSLMGDVTQISDLIQLAATDVAKHAMEKVQGEISKIASSAPSYMLSRASYWGKVILQEELSDIAKKHLQDGGDAAVKQADKNKESGLTKVMNYVNTYVGKVTEKVNEFTTYMQKYGDDISTFSAQGPQWVTGKVNKIKEDAIEEIDDFVDKQSKNILKNRNNILDGVAKGVAKSLVQPTINAMNKKVDDMTNTSNKSKKKVLQKAKTQIQKAKYKLAGMLGIAPL